MVAASFRTLALPAASHEEEASAFLTGTAASERMGWMAGYQQK